MRALLRAYAGPTLLINGVNDFQRPYEQALVAAAPNLRLQPIANASHWPNIEQPESYQRAIRQFARSIGGTT